MNPQRIEIGDTVDVFFSTTDAEFSVVLEYSPGFDNDVYVCVRQDGTPVYIKQFDKIVLVKKNHNLKINRR